MPTYSDYVPLRESLLSETSQRPQADPIIDRLEQAQNEITRLKKAYDDVVEKRNHLKVECRMGIENMCAAARKNDFLQAQLSNIMQNSNAKEISRLQSERDAAVHDYNLVMQERDSVHKEIERLQEDLSESQRTCSILETEKRMSASEIESLKEKLDQTTKEKNRLALYCQDLRKQVNSLMSMMAPNSSSTYPHQSSPQQVGGLLQTSLHMNLQTLGSATLNDRCRHYTSLASSPQPNHGTRSSNYSSVPLSTPRFNHNTWQSRSKDTIGTMAHLDGVDRSAAATASDNGKTSLSNSIYDNHRLASHATSLYQEIPYTSKFNGLNPPESIKQQHKQQQRAQSPYSSLCGYGASNRSTTTNSLADSISHMRMNSGDKGIAGNGQQSLMPVNEHASREYQMLKSTIDDLTYRLTEAQSDARRLARNRDFALIERDKLVSERNSIRLLCDRLRRERDGAVSKLAEAVHDSNNYRLLMAEQKIENMKELKNIQERYDARHDRDTLSSNASIATNKDHHHNYLQQQNQQQQLLYHHYHQHHYAQFRRPPKDCKLFASQQVFTNRQSSLNSMMSQMEYHGISMESDSNSSEVVSSSTTAMNSANQNLNQTKSQSISNNNNSSNSRSIKCSNNIATSTPLGTPTSTGGFFCMNHNNSHKHQSQAISSQDQAASNKLQTTPCGSLNKTTNLDHRIANHNHQQQQLLATNKKATTNHQANTTITSHESAVDADFSFELPVIKVNEISAKDYDGCDKRSYQRHESMEQLTGHQDENCLVKYGFEISDTNESGVKGIFVSSIRKGSQVEKFLEVGDQLLDVNGVNLRQATCDLTTTKKLFKHYYQLENPIRVACRRRTLNIDTEPSSLAKLTKAPDSRTIELAKTAELISSALTSTIN